jgi:cell wall-associated NlpC family hydrolase
VATRSRRTAIRAVVGVTAATLALTVLPSMSTQATPAPSIADVTRQVNALNDEASVANEQFLAAQIDVANAQRKMSGVKARIAREQKNLSVVRQDIGALASMAYRNGGLDSTLELLLSDNPTDFLNRSASLDQVSRGQGASLRKAQVAQQRLAQDKLALAQQLGALTAAQQRARDAKNSIDSKVGQARALLARLTAAQRARYQAAQAARAAAALRASRSAIRTLSTYSPPPSSSSSSSSSSSGGGGGFSGGGSVSGRAAIAVAYVKSKVGDPYVWGASGPNAFDCSGLTMAAWAAAGVSLGHYTGAQYGETSRVSRSDLQPGDLIFFYGGLSHVGMYIGGGLMIHASNPSTGVEVSSLSGYWSSVYAGAGRV